MGVRYPTISIITLATLTTSSASEYVLDYVDICEIADVTAAKNSFKLPALHVLTGCLNWRSKYETSHKCQNKA